MGTDGDVTGDVNSVSGLANESESEDENESADESESAYESWNGSPKQDLLRQIGFERVVELNERRF